MRKIAIYGKGGIGKSTFTSSLAVALSMLGYKVMQIGCDPKADSTINITNGNPVVPVLTYLKENGDCSSIEEIVKEGYNGILCVEAGGPTPGLGCAGRGIITMLDLLDELDALEVYKPDYVLYDVLGDVVCGGFAVPMRGEYADEIIIVTSGEKMSLFAAGNIKLAIDNFSNRGYAKLLGIVLNSRNIKDEKAIVKEFANQIDTNIIGIIPRDDNIQTYEKDNMTVIQGNISLPISRVIMDIARNLTSSNKTEQVDALQKKCI